MNEREWKKVRNVQAGILIGLAAFAFIVGIVIIICGNYFQYSAGDAYSSYKRTTAVVVDNREDVQYDDDGFLMRRYYAEMKYEADGKEYVFEYSISTVRPYEIGKEYVIMYNPDDPSQHVMANKERTVMIISSVMAAIVMFLGLGLLAAAVDKLRKRYVPRRKVKSQDAD